MGIPQKPVSTDDWSDKWRFCWGRGYPFFSASLSQKSKMILRLDFVNFNIFSDSQVNQNSPDSSDSSFSCCHSLRLLYYFKQPIEWYLYSSPHFFSLNKFRGTRLKLSTSQPWLFTLGLFATTSHSWKTSVSFAVVKKWTMLFSLSNLITSRRENNEYLIWTKSFDLQEDRFPQYVTVVSQRKRELLVTRGMVAV